MPDGQINWSSFCWSEIKVPIQFNQSNNFCEGSAKKWELFKVVSHWSKSALRHKLIFWMLKPCFLFIWLIKSELNWNLWISNNLNRPFVYQGPGGTNLPHPEQTQACENKTLPSCNFVYRRYGNKEEHIAIHKADGLMASRLCLVQLLWNGKVSIGCEWELPAGTVSEECSVRQQAIRRLCE